MTTTSRRSTLAFLITGGLLYTGVSQAHSASPGGETGQVFEASGGWLAAKHYIETDAGSAKGWFTGPALNLEFAYRLNAKFSSGFELGAAFLPISPNSLDVDDEEDADLDHELDSPASFLVSGLWMNHVQLGALTLRLGLGPTIDHLTDGSGAFVEGTSYGAMEKLGLGWKWGTGPTLGFAAISGVLTQTLAAHHSDPGVERLVTFGVLASIGFSYDPHATQQAKAPGP